MFLIRTSMVQSRSNDMRALTRFADSGSNCWVFFLKHTKSEIVYLMAFTGNSNSDSYNLP
jgi:hypothetical protein